MATVPKFFLDLYNLLLVRDSELLRRILNSGSDGPIRAFSALAKEFSPKQARVRSEVNEYAQQARVRSEVNEYAQSVDFQIDRLREMGRNLGWDLGEDILESLRRSAPPWPVGPCAFRSFRIRMGSTNQTVDAHFRAIQETFGANNLEISFDLDPRDFRKIGLSTDVPEEICWVTIDLDRNLGIPAHEVQSKRTQSLLADELLCFLWMFPLVTKSLSCERFPTVVVAGYLLRTFTGGRAISYGETVSVGYVHTAGKVVFRRIPVGSSRQDRAIPELLC